MALPGQISPSLPRAANPKPSSIILNQKNSSLWSPSSWLLLVLWLSTLGLWAWQSRNKKRALKKQRSNSTEQQYWQVLQKALSSDTPQQIYSPLSQWLGEVCGNAQLALPISQRKLNDPALDAQLSLMLGMRYAKTPLGWTGEALLKELKRVRKVHFNSKKSKQVLKGMYPQAN